MLLSSSMCGPRHSQLLFHLLTPSVACSLPLHTVLFLLSMASIRDCTVFLDSSFKIGEVCRLTFSVVTCAPVPEGAAPNQTGTIMVADAQGMIAKLDVPRKNWQHIIDQCDKEDFNVTFCATRVKKQAIGTYKMSTLRSIGCTDYYFIVCEDSAIGSKTGSLTTHPLLNDSVGLRDWRFLIARVLDVTEVACVVKTATGGTANGVRREYKIVYSAPGQSSTFLMDTIAFFNPPKSTPLVSKNQVACFVAFHRNKRDDGFINGGQSRVFLEPIGQTMCQAMAAIANALPAETAATDAAPAADLPDGFAAL